MKTFKNANEHFTKNKSKSKITVFALRSVISERKFDHNMQNRLFKARLHSYEIKKKTYLSSSVDLNQAYEKCKEISKNVSAPLLAHFDDVHDVVARTVDKTFDMRVVHSRKIMKKLNIKCMKSKTPNRTVNNIVLDDLVVWSSSSLIEDVLSVIAVKLIDIHSDLWNIITRLLEDNDRLRGWMATVSGYDRSVDEEITTLLAASQSTDLESIKAEQKIKLVKMMSNLNALLSKAEPKVGEPDGPYNNQIMYVGGAGIQYSDNFFIKRKSQTAQLKALQRELLLVNDRLVMTDKKNRDLFDIIHYNQFNSQIGAVRLKLKREKEKSAHLQSIINDMYLLKYIYRKRK